MKKILDKYALTILLLSPLNILIGYRLWRTGVDIIGAIGVTLFAAFFLLLLYSILKPGEFLGVSGKYGSCKTRICYRSKPVSYWFVVIFILTCYVGVTFVTGYAALHRN